MNTSIMSTYCILFLFFSFIAVFIHFELFGQSLVLSECGCFVICREKRHTQLIPEVQQQVLNNTISKYGIYIYIINTKIVHTSM